MNSNEEKHVAESYDLSAKRYYERWPVAHPFTRLRRKPRVYPWMNAAGNRGVAPKERSRVMLRRGSAQRAQQRGPRACPWGSTEEDRSKFCAHLPPHGRILDVGCGPGNDTTYYIEKGFSVVGIDLSKEMVGLASGRESRAQFQEMDMRHLTFDDNSFDGVWASYSFMHVKESDAKKTLQQFKRVLRRGGYLCLLVHTNETTTYKKTQITGLFDDEGKPMDTYVQEWKQEELLKLLEGVGFELCAVRPFERTGGLYHLFTVMARIAK